LVGGGSDVVREPFVFSSRGGVICFLGGCFVFLCVLLVFVEKVMFLFFLLYGCMSAGHSFRYRKCLSFFERLDAACRRFVGLFIVRGCRVLVFVAFFSRLVGCGGVFLLAFLGWGWLLN